MMNRQTIASIGTFDFSSVELMHAMELYVDIAELSEELTTEVNCAVDAGKEKFLTEWKKCVDLYGWRWSEKGVNLDPKLHIVMGTDGKIKYELSVFFQDVECPDLFDGINIAIDMVKHEAELKKLIIQSLIEKFF